jgi:hypothetical protein
MISLYTILYYTMKTKRRSLIKSRYRFGLHPSFQKRKKTFKLFPRNKKQQGGFSTSQLVTVVSRNPLYEYASRVHKDTKGIRPLYHTSEYLEIPSSIQDEIESVDAWLAQIVLFGKMMKEHEMTEELYPRYKRVIEIKNVKENIE